MNLLEWGILVLVVWPLVQVPGLFYLSHRVELEEGTRPLSYLPGDAAGPERTDTPARRPSTATCRACGVDNDRSFTYCRACTARL